MPDVPDKQIKRLRALIQEAETNLAAATELLVSLVGDDEKVAPVAREETLGKVIEGVFDGQNMVGSDGKIYPVPANYASKSKLVQGDILKLTIAEDGASCISKSARFHASRLLARSFLKVATISSMSAARSCAFSWLA